MENKRSLEFGLHHESHRDLGTESNSCVRAAAPPLKSRVLTSDPDSESSYPQSIPIATSYLLIGLVAQMPMHMDRHMTLTQLSGRIGSQFPSERLSFSHSHWFG